MVQKTILVIEDNIKNLKLVRALLTMGNHTVLEAESAETGLDIARTNLPNLILMDIQLPGMNGLEATRIAKQDNKLKNIPIVAITSYAMEGDEQNAIEAGCDGYITKPIDTRSFLNQIAHYCHPTSDMSEQSEPEVQTYKGAKILIVDDDSKNLKLMQGILASKGYEIFIANNGTEALDRLKRQNIDVILLDILMPGIDGYEVTRRIKSHPDTQDIPIILVTALDSQNDKIRGMDSGAEEFLTKPVKPVEVETRVESMLRLKRYRDQLDIRERSREQPDKSIIPVKQFNLKAGSTRMLVVEDDEKDLKLLLHYFDQSESVIDIAVFGKDAVTLLERHSYDIVLMDIALPDINGFQICRQIKGEDRLKDTQVLLMSSLDDLENRIQGLEVGADDYLLKPFDFRELHARIQALLKKKLYIDHLRQQYEKALNHALMDGLTGLYNHSYFKRFLELEIMRSERQGHSTALLMIDLDDFKHINDSLGHPVGDEILRNFAKLLLTKIREIDVAARYGGEEFAVVMPYGDRETLHEVGRRICKATAAMEIPEQWQHAISKITVSIGGALFPDEAKTLEELIEAADYMLYKAKRAGKNQMIISKST